MLHVDSIDPSLALCFYCRNREDFEDFYTRALHEMDELPNSYIFSVARVTPQYTSSDRGSGSKSKSKSSSGDWSEEIEDEFEML
jgi:cysteine protease ATG4